MIQSRTSIGRTLHGWTTTLLVYVEILTRRGLVGVFGIVLGWFKMRFHRLGNKRTSNLLVSKESTYSLTSMTLSPITTSNHSILSNHTRLLWMPAQSEKPLNL